MNKRLVSQTTKVTDLTAELSEQMFRLMCRHYRQVRREDFDRDLADKDWVILLHAPSSGEVVGFSTLKRFEHRYLGQRLRIVFSGDTIIEPNHWGSMELPLSFGRLMLSVQAEEPATPLYWMLISKGFRTYRFLPVFFREFYPRHDCRTPDWEAGLIDDLAGTLFPGAYQRDRGVLSFNGTSQILRSELENVPDLRRQNDPHIRFFHDRNPGHDAGDELVCLSRFHRDNLIGFINRRLDQEPQRQPIPVP